MSGRLTAIILAGGLSTRMGTDKALLCLSSGETLLERSVALAASVASDVKLIGPRERYANFSPALELVEDVYPDCGPLAGIHAGLKASQTELNLVLAVDMPAVTRELLQFLVQAAEQSNSLVTAVKVDERWQPLCAVYRKPFAEVAEQALRAGRYKVDSTFTVENTHLITEDDLRNAGFSPELFANCNTSNDWKQFATRSPER